MARSDPLRVDLLRPQDAKWPEDDDEAAERAHRYLNHDPFPDLPPALLGSGALIDYARITGMIFPLFGVDKEDSSVDRRIVKPASYEIRPGESFFYFDTHGHRRCQDLTKQESKPYISLEANSITFCSIDENIRLPNYIAMRFNLRIKHVHRGLLLGTGPLVDPGFHKKLLIPLHNLTDSPYTISLNEGLIWAEFTKTFRKPEDTREGTGKDVALNPDTQKDFNTFFMAASGGAPIRSSIPTAVEKAEMRADQALRQVDELRKDLRSLSIAAVLGIIIALFAIIIPVLDLVNSATNK